jgi:endonuclease/exonuclease/phosphatase family metal-dependent hydrolase
MNFALRLVVTALAVSIPATLSAQDTIRVCTYNTLLYSVSNEDGRTAKFRDILNEIKPHILVCQEVDDASLGPRFVTDVMTWGSFAASPYHDGPDTDNQILYDQSKFALQSVEYLSTELRDIGVYVLSRLNTFAPDTITIYSVHLKAQDNSEDAQQRLREVQVLQAHAAGRERVIVLGDFNIYGPQEPAYKALLQPTTGLTFVDPLGTTWQRNVVAYLPFYTQATRTDGDAACGGGVGGGLDDRFDLILVTENLKDKVIPGSYRVLGNDGQDRRAGSIDVPVNTAVSPAIAAALRCASDHLPVYTDIVWGEVPASVQDDAATSWLRQEGSTLVITTNEHHAPMRIFDLLGRQVLAEQPLPSPWRVDVSGLHQSGTYVVNVGTQWAPIHITAR